MNNKENKQGGFLRFIIVFIIAILIMKYLHITFADVFEWIKNFFQSFSK